MILFSSLVLALHFPNRFQITFQQTFMICLLFPTRFHDAKGKILKIWWELMNSYWAYTWLLLPSLTTELPILTCYESNRSQSCSDSREKKIDSQANTRLAFMIFFTVEFLHHVSWIFCFKNHPLWGLNFGGNQSKSVVTVEAKVWKNFWTLNSWEFWCMRKLHIKARNTSRELFTHENIFNDKRVCCCQCHRKTSWRLNALLRLQKLAINSRVDAAMSFLAYRVSI